MTWVLGVDPGATTAFVLVGEDGRVLHSDEEKFGKWKGLDRFHMIQQATLDVLDRVSQLVASNGNPKVYVVIEDVSTAHGFVNKTTRARRTSHSIASLQRDYAALVMAFVIGIQSVGHIEEVILAPIAKWYPRIGGRLIAKPEAIRYLRQSCRGDNLQSEHLVMAYGIASWGLGHFRTLEQIRRARTT